MNDLIKTNIHNFIMTHFIVVYYENGYFTDTDNMYIIKVPLTDNAYRILVDDDIIIQCLNEHYFDENGVDYGYDNASDLKWFTTDKTKSNDDIIAVVDDFEHYANMIHGTIAQNEKHGNFTETIIQ